MDVKVLQNDNRSLSFDTKMSLFHSSYEQPDHLSTNPHSTNIVFIGRTDSHAHTHTPAHAHLTGPKHYISDCIPAKSLSQWNASLPCAMISQRTHWALFSFLTHSLSLFLPLTQALFLNVCLKRHNKIWSPYSRRDSRVLKRYWRRETPLCDRGQRRDSMSEKKRERVCQSLELMEPSFTKMLIIAVFVCVGLFQQVLSHTQL